MNEQHDVAAAARSDLLQQMLRSRKSLFGLFAFGVAGAASFPFLSPPHVASASSSPSSALPPAPAPAPVALAMRDAFPSDASQAREVPASMPGTASVAEADPPSARLQAPVAKPGRAAGAHHAHTSPNYSPPLSAAPAALITPYIEADFPLPLAKAQVRPIAAQPGGENGHDKAPAGPISTQANGESGEGKVQAVPTKSPSEALRVVATSTAAAPAPPTLTSTLAVVEPPKEPVPAPPLATSLVGKPLVAGAVPAPDQRQLDERPAALPAQAAAAQDTRVPVQRALDTPPADAWRLAKEAAQGAVDVAVAEPSSEQAEPIARTQALEPAVMAAGVAEVAEDTEVITVSAASSASLPAQEDGLQLRLNSGAAGSGQPDGMAARFTEQAPQPIDRQAQQEVVIVVAASGNNAVQDATPQRAYRENVRVVSTQGVDQAEPFPGVGALDLRLSTGLQGGGLSPVAGAAQLPAWVKMNPETGRFTRTD